MKKRISVSVNNIAETRATCLQAWASNHEQLSLLNPTSYCINTEINPCDPHLTWFHNSHTHTHIRPKLHWWQFKGMHWHAWQSVPDLGDYFTSSAILRWMRIRCKQLSARLSFIQIVLRASWTVILNPLILADIHSPCRVCMPGRADVVTTTSTSLSAQFHHWIIL